MSGSPSARQVDVRVDDATIRCYVTGSLEAPAIVAHHGTPGTGLQGAAAFLSAGVHGACHIAFDRPGYGGSTRMEGRRVADVAWIVRAILDELGVERAAVIGSSGGGPHALATAALLPDRITRAALVACMAPVGRPDLDYFDGQIPLMADEMRAALAGPQASRAFLAGLVAENPESPFGSGMTDGDRRVAEQLRPVSEALIRALRAEDTVTRFEDGYVDDLQAFAAPWGFEPGSVAVPVHLLQGTEDLMVPVAHARWLRDRIPGASLDVLPGLGHLLHSQHATAFAWLRAERDSDRPTTAPSF